MYSGWGGQADNGSENTVYSYNDDFTWIHGSHNFKFGGAFQINHYNGLGRQCEAGCLGFSFTETGKPNGNQSRTRAVILSPRFYWAMPIPGQIDTPRFIGQQFPYYAGFFQDDWHVTRKLVLNLGLRGKPICLRLGWTIAGLISRQPSESRRRRPPGSCYFAGSGTGRQGSRTLADSYFGAFGPRLGFAYSSNEEDCDPCSVARPLARYGCHRFDPQHGLYLDANLSQSKWRYPAYLLVNQGMPPWTAPPFINPSVSNNTSVSWWQGPETTRPPEFDNSNFSIQRQLSSNTILRSLTMACRLPPASSAPRLQPGQSCFAHRLRQYRAEHRGLNSNVGPTSPTQLGIVAPIRLQRNCPTGFRPFPQYTVIDTFGGQGDQVAIPHITLDSLPREALQRRGYFSDLVRIFKDHNRCR